MSITNKIKYLDITADTTIEQIAEALGCEGFTHSFNDVSYGILTMEPIGIPMPNCGFAITGLGTTTWTLHAYINGAPVTTTHIKTMSGVMSYIVSENFKIWGTGNGNLYDGYGFIKGKDMTMPGTPEMWECYTQYSGNTGTNNVILWDKYSTATNHISNLTALTNNNNLVILEPLYNYVTGWLSETEVYYCTNRPASYNTAGMVYNFSMDDKEYLLLTCLGTITSAKSLICFDVTNVPDLS